MTLFDECKESLRADFNIVIGSEEKKAIDLLYSYPVITGGGVLWKEMKYADYDDLYDILNENLLKKLRCICLSG